MAAVRRFVRWIGKIPATRAEGVREVCAWCPQSRWRPRIQSRYASHSICPNCRAEFDRQIDETAN